MPMGQLNGSRLQCRTEERGRELARHYFDRVGLCSARALRMTRARSVWARARPSILSTTDDESPELR